MPPLRTDRASKACVTCRRQKTRCYRSESTSATCLRCQTLHQPCSLEPQHDDTITARRSSSRHDAAESTAVNERLDRLEDVLAKLVDRIDSRLDVTTPVLNPRATEGEREESLREPNKAPVILIRDAATEIGIQSPGDTLASPPSRSHILSKGLLSYPEAYELMSIFQEHYGRWVRFDETSSTHELLTLTAKSPLLLCSACLIAVRHTTDGLASRLAPALLDEAQALVSKSLLTMDNSLHFFQAALILSLWSTTVGQVPLSIDGWLLTSYAIQQALANPEFAFLSRPPSTIASTGFLDRWCVWNHLCLAHLQYCVGTRRKAALRESDIRACELLSDRADLHHLSNFEVRMVAEIKLYWITYVHCVNTPIDPGTAEVTLRAWRTEWEHLFDQPRSQFLQIGYHFSLLLSLRQTVTATHDRMSESPLSEVIRLTASIINLVMDTADERTQHLTDHIYHVITFSAITLCQLLQKYEDQLHLSYDIAALDLLVTRLVTWLKSIGLTCHVAHMLGGLVSAQQGTLRPDTVETSRVSLASRDMPSPNVLFPEIIWEEMLDRETSLWPPWDQFFS